MAAEFVDAMLYANLALSAAILFVLIMRAPMKRLFGPRVAYGLWLAVPLAGTASFLPAPVIHAPAIAASTDISLPMSVVARYAESGRQAVDVQLPAFEYGTVLLLAAWVVGLVISAGILALRQKRFIAALGRLGQRAHDGTTMFLAESATIGPAVVGMFAPRIILPSDFETRFSADEQLVVLAHERAHLERGDAQINGFVLALRCLCWFNPLVHLASLYQRQDQEMACDAIVVARHPGKRRSYAQALLKAQLAKDRLPLGCYWPASADHPLKTRITLLEWSDRTPAIPWTGIAAVSLSGLCAGYMAWAAQPPRVAIEIAEPMRVTPQSAGVEDRAPTGIRSLSPAGGGAEKSHTHAPARMAARADISDGAVQSGESVSRSDSSDEAALRNADEVAYRFASRFVSYKVDFDRASAAAGQGDARAMSRLAGLYGSGMAVQKDDAGALALYRQIAEAGDDTRVGDMTVSGQAMFALAWIHDVGKGANGLGRDPAEAAIWYRRWARTVKPSSYLAQYAAQVLARLDSPAYVTGNSLPLLPPPFRG